VALTAPAAARLRGRWPHKRIEVIPPGCPPWRPSPRPAGGRTVAVLGDAGAATEDLVEALLEALRALPGARLLVLLPVGARRRAAGEQMPRRSVAAVRFVPLPDASDEELARRLGEMADVVVFWEGEDEGGSGALAGIALASGLPILAAPLPVNGQQADLVGPVFRPEDLAAGLEEVLEDPERRAELAGAARAYCDEFGWQRIAALHLALWRTLVT
jgi:glycosyltransferase involved in cell wall biosynthesis